MTIEDCVIKMFHLDTFKNPEDGTERKRYTYYLQIENSEGNTEVFKVNSKKDFSKYVDKPGTAHITAYPQEKGSGFWLSLTEFNTHIQ